MRQGEGGSGSRSAGLLLPIAVALIAVAAVFLGFMQFRWVSRVSEAEESRLKQSLRVSAAQMLSSTSDEVRVLQALLFITGEEYASEDWRRFGAAIRFWKENTRFPGLLTSVYLIRVEQQETKPRYLEYSEETGAFLAVEEPEPLRGIFSASRFTETHFRAQAEELLRRGILLSSVGFRGGGQRDEGASARVTPPPGAPLLLAVAFDLDVAYRKVIPFYMQQLLEGYPYRITDTASGAILTASGETEASRRPDLSIELRGPLLFWSRFFAEPERRQQPQDQASRVLEQYAQQDPAVRFWLQRSSGAISPDIRRWLDGEEKKEAALRLDIFYPGVPIQALVSTRRAVNLALSAGVLLLLVAATVVLFRLYRNATRLRAMEQEFVASMSHELRTPIAVLQSTSENLKAGLITDSGRVSKYSEVIHRETRRLAGMVEGILLYSGMENRSQRSVTLVATDVSRLAVEIAAALQGPAQEARCTIRVIDRSSIAEARSDPVALRLILENLLLNAIRHGLPAVRSADHQAEVRLIVERRLFNRELVIVVEDDGPGVPAREAGRIFEPFVRGEASVRAQHPGSGLGLHLVRRVVRILGGTIRLESPYRNTLGRLQPGCRFTVELPAAAKEEHAEDTDHRR